MMGANHLKTRSSLGEQALGLVPRRAVHYACWRSQLDQTDYMRGIISTLNRQGAMLVPVASPIVYVKTETISPDQLGEITSASKHYAKYAEILAETVHQGYARLVAGP